MAIGGIPGSDDYVGLPDVLQFSAPPQHPVITVAVDTLVMRTDLGAGRTTFVKAGDHVPVPLEALPRAPA